jgi:nucleotide-binding universal stress UspA family protein
MTTHGRGGFVRAWLGSVADALVRRGGVPVLLVRPEPAAARDAAEATEAADFTGVADPAGLDLATAPPLDHVLVPLDGSALAEQILEPALALGRSGELRVTLLRVAPAPPSALPVEQTFVTPDEAAAMRRAREEAEAYLAGVAERLRAAGHAVEAVVVADHDPARAILRAARERGAQVVALSTNGRGGLARLRLGSVADKLVRGGTCPTLVLRPRETGE